MEHTREIMNLFSGHGLKVKLSKGELAKREVSLLGNVVDKNGIRVDFKKGEVTRSTPRPTNQTELQSFLGFAGYYCRFIQSFALLSTPVHAVASCKREALWTSDRDKEFKALEEALSSPPVLTFLDFDRLFNVETNASAVAIGAALSQKNEDKKYIQFSLQAAQ